MSGKKKPAGPVNAELRVDPEKRVVSKFDEKSIAKFPVADTRTMGFPVKDDCAEEHIM